MVEYTLYVVDDEETIRDSIVMALEETYRVAAFASAEEALDAMQGDPPDLVLLDIGLPGMDGIEALGQIQRLQPGLLTVMITAFEDIDTVIAAMKLGAYDYVVKPLHMEGLATTIRNALETIRLRKEVQLLRKQVLQDHVPCFIARSNVIQDVMEFVEQVAQSPDTPVLIQGETGTGKELVAGVIHYQSPNFKGPFVPVNCAAIPANLVESELFGYEKGAFSGAAAGKRGLLEAAAGGTLFLDEVGDLGPETQAKLLRFLELGEFYRLGGIEKQALQTRVVSATNKDLEQMTAAGLFRKDLYFRLGVIRVKIPSLNARPDDILPLARHFLVAFENKFGKSFTGFSPAAEHALVAHRWTGNVRELKNVIERGALIGKGPDLHPGDLGLENADGLAPANGMSGAGPFTPLPPEGLDLTALETALEKYYLEAALEMAAGNESRAARLLHLNHHTFRYRLKKLRSESS